MSVLSKVKNFFSRLKGGNKKQKEQNETVFSSGNGEAGEIQRGSVSVQSFTSRWLSKVRQGLRRNPRGTPRRSRHITKSSKLTVVEKPEQSFIQVQPASSPIKKNPKSNSMHVPVKKKSSSVTAKNFNNDHKTNLHLSSSTGGETRSMLRTWDDDEDGRRMNDQYFSVKSIPVSVLEEMETDTTPKKLNELAEGNGVTESERFAPVAPPKVLKVKKEKPPPKNLKSKEVDEVVLPTELLKKQFSKAKTLTKSSKVLVSSTRFKSLGLAVEQNADKENEEDDLDSLLCSPNYMKTVGRAKKKVEVEPIEEEM